MEHLSKAAFVFYNNGRKFQGNIRKNFINSKFQFVDNQYNTSDFLKKQKGKFLFDTLQSGKKNEQQTLTDGPENRCSYCIEKILGNKTTGETSFWLKTPATLIVGESRLRKEQNREHGFCPLVGCSANKLLKAAILLVQELIKQEKQIMSLL